MKKNYRKISTLNMDAQVDDFFNEINEIAPPKQIICSRDETDWEECIDDQTGYTYYWNKKTNEVTWNTPTELKYQSKTNSKSNDLLRLTKSYMPPTPKAKIYSIAKSADTKLSKPKKKPQKEHSDHNHSGSEDEKIELISSYGNESESDSEPETKKIKNVYKTSNEILDESYNSDEDVGDILTKIQKRVQEMKKERNESGEVQINNKKEQKPPPVNVESVSEQTGISLIAGYSDSEEETEEIRPAFEVEPKPQVSYSTLFPIAKPIDIKDFTTPEVDESFNSSVTQGFDNKAFKRKRRIGVALINTAKKKEVSITECSDGIERKGLGFDKHSPASPSNDNTYNNFSKGGVLFVKADVLNPALPTASITTTDTIKSKDTPVMDELKDMYSTLKEKLCFLNVGRPDMSPVQVMLIQSETLFVAMNDGGLKQSYLEKWLSDTCSELIKLEKDATPEGWQLQWDRQHKRYFYRNDLTGASQWEYPTAVTSPEGSDSDAMDICTTPPPTDEPLISESPPPPPLPPAIRSPTPPPPPLISHEEFALKKAPLDVPLPVETVPVRNPVISGEPLPPGVDLPEISTENDEKSSTDPLNSALDSFYSDIAAISSSKDDDDNTSAPPLPPPPVVDNVQPGITSEQFKKKKKSKVKLSAGITMKKKGVVQLVEKWKNVQQNYD